MKLITSARIPVLKIKSTSGVPVDITISDSTHHTGLRARDLIVRYLEEAPQLAPMVVVLKSFLRELGLNDPYTGGMSSYSLVVLLWNYLCEVRCWPLVSSRAEPIAACCVTLASGTPV